MGKVELNKQQKRETLLNTSFELFTTKGLSKTSISDIVERAGVAKGTFYLYFKDKLDIRDRLILHKAGELFTAAYKALQETGITDLPDKLIFMTDNILDALAANKPLLTLLYKDLSWGVFKRVLTETPGESEVDFADVYRRMVEESGMVLREPEVMLFMIVELVGSTGYSAIIYGDPVDVDSLKPHLAQVIRDIVKDHTVTAE